MTDAAIEAIESEAETDDVRVHQDIEAHALLAEKAK